jgi:hypothetical protein
MRSTWISSRACRCCAARKCAHGSCRCCTIRSTVDWLHVACGTLHHAARCILHAFTACCQCNMRHSMCHIAHARSDSFSHAAASFSFSSDHALTHAADLDSVLLLSGLSIHSEAQGQGDEVCPPRFAESLVDAMHRGQSLPASFPSVLQHP